ncbi:MULTISPECIES: L,D-transpeptidase family protein [unclassified Enterococcus]|uniref:L,D-transpeptidase family protein n=1 Tax=unclassified Enterococcus TaxID=2608891 RepID=UPI001CE132C6|nr:MULTISPECIES: L,D-transpeptidase [unclassified Enterococcus]MCA5011385.1 L,D-transpeptidase family protein [Enterococcus sp. S23]MCA5015173.1 L,D-transpeptidase family protein [Enterococcus sp. S22(2020)]
MENEETVSRSAKNGRAPQNNNHSNKKKNRWLVPVVGLLIGLSLVFTVGLFYFQSHFFVTAKANGVDIGFLSVKDAKKKLEELNKSEPVVIKADGKEETIELPEKYEITEEYLKQSISNRSIKLPINEDYKNELKNKLGALSFAEGTPSQDAKVEKVDGVYQIVPEQLGTTVDKEALIAQVLKDVDENKGTYVYDVKDFYQKPAVTKDDKGLQDKLAVLSKKENKSITLDINGEKLTLTKEELQSFMNESGDVDPNKVYAWVEQTNQKYGSIFKPIIFTNVHGVTTKYKNNGSYGWDINMPQTRDLIVQAINSEKETEEITVPIDGDVTQSSTVNKDYVEIDLNDQKMYFFKDGAKVVETDVITGRYNKGTATVPGFHTILYKDTDTKLEGEMLDGSEYSVPVKYWMPLKSYGGVVTQIGIHDADYKAEYFGNKEAYKTNFGSNGCINTPGDAVAQIFNGAYAGMPVIIYGHIYDDAPGEFDKPVDYGEPA